MYNHFLMRKNDIVAIIELDEAGHIYKVLKDSINTELAPIANKNKAVWLSEWWDNRAVPITQSRIKEFLEKSGYISPTDFLAKNIGLSLTDYYWIKPFDSDLSWEKVSLFSNNFKENILFKNKINTDKNEVIESYSPNSSLQGDIEKTWAIINNERCLVKGNRTNLSSESINEVIASEIHKLQGYNNYTNYNLVRIKDRDYLYGCVSKAFTSENVELLSAYALYSSVPKRNEVSPSEHYINICHSYGYDVEKLQYELDYQTMTDFIMSQYDRHLNNFGMLRDANSLQLISIAPIFDSGGALFANKGKPYNVKDLLSIKTNGWTATERTMLKSVKNKNCIDLTKLPPRSFVENMYAKDTQMHEEDIKTIAYYYEKKIDICKEIQLGKDPWKKQYSLSQPSSNNLDFKKPLKEVLRDADIVIQSGETPHSTILSNDDLSL